MYTINKIASVVSGDISGNAESTVVYLSVDSRKISFPSQTLFFALKTERRDGHLFIKEVYDQGVRSFIVSEIIEEGIFPDAVFIQVNETLKALQQLAAYHRSQFNYPVIGITGSNGKTIVKEWLNQLLQEDYKIVRSPKSYNSQIGVPLSVWQMNASHQLAIFEAGISKPGEMEALEKIICPTIGVLTNIGTAHDEGFENSRQKLFEKLQLFDNENTAVIYCADNEMIPEAATEFPFIKYEWGISKNIWMQVNKIERHHEYSDITLVTLASSGTYRLPFTDNASIENAIHCIAVCKYLGMEEKKIAERILLLHPVEMRLEWKKAINNCYLLNDSYSNDLSSFIIALDYLQQQHQANRQTIILSDFYESGLSDDELYTKVAALLRQRNIERLIGIGLNIEHYKHLFKAGINTSFYPSTEAFIEDFDSSIFTNESILLKGARKFGFERIVHLLEQQVHQTVLEINLTALTHNLQQYRKLLQPNVKMMAMVKAFGYGSGDAEVAKVLQFNKVDYLAVAYADEGVALRKAAIHLPVMVMNPEPSTFEIIESNNLEPELYSFNILRAFENYCRVQGITQYPVHLKIDTGMFRLGFEIQEIKELAEWFSNQETLVVKSVFTHLVASEDPQHDAFTKQQADQFSKACLLLEKKLSYPFLKHAANTAGIRRHPNMHFNMVRLGIGLYGVDSGEISLEVVTTLKTTVAQIKKVKAGETVGYGRKGMAVKDSVIATVRIGYADGFRRQLGNGNGKMFVNGQAAPVIGNVSMDMTMIDVTGIGNVNPGDEVEIFGKNISIREVAEQCSTISYEIMTGVSQRVKRVYVQE